MDIYSWSREPLFIRAVSLYLPILLCFALWVWRNPTKQEATGSLLASLWAFSALLALQACVQWFDWWHFEADGGLFINVPVDLLIGWVLLWATIPSLLPRSWPIFMIMFALAMLDLLFMPLLSPVLQLGSQWIVGEVFGILLVTWPALLVARWTAIDSQLNGRVGIQIVIFGTLIFVLLPAIGVVWNVVDLQNIWLRPRWQLSLLAQVLAVPALIGLSAVQEFAIRGEGTPLPLDPPKQLVTTGIYAYVANPMQLSGSIILIVLGLSFNSLWFTLGALMACIYSMGVADWSEQADLQERYGANWVEYRRQIRKWRFRWKPWGGSKIGRDEDETAIGILYIGRACEPCSEVRIWFENQATIALTVVDAEHHPSRDLTRITYESADGKTIATGVAAIARGLEHINFGWAMVGFALRLPVINQLVQLIVDGCGGEARPIKREAF